MLDSIPFAAIYGLAVIVIMGLLTDWRISQEKAAVEKEVQAQKDLARVGIAKVSPPSSSSCCLLEIFTIGDKSLVLDAGMSCGPRIIALHTVPMIVILQPGASGWRGTLEDRTRACCQGGLGTLTAIPP